MSSLSVSKHTFNTSSVNALGVALKEPTGQRTGSAWAVIHPVLCAVGQLRTSALRVILACCTFSTLGSVSKLAQRDIIQVSIFSR